MNKFTKWKSTGVTDLVAFYIIVATGKNMFKFRKITQNENIVLGAEIDVANQNTLLAINVMSSFRVNIVLTSNKSVLFNKYLQGIE